MRHSRLFGLPERSERFAVFGLTIAFILVFVTFYSAASALSAHIPFSIHVDFGFERAIPFVPSASALYLSMDLLVGLAPFILRDLRSILPLFLTLCGQTVVGALCFLILPVETSFPARVVVGADAPLFFVADLLNLERNYLPSLHVGFAVTAALAYSDRVGLLGKVLFSSWALAIAASTLLIHEHHLVDVVAGGLLAWLCWRSLGAWARREPVLEAFDVELLCLGNAFLFARRHLRYLMIWLVVVRASFPSFRQRRVLRTGFCFLQALDDLLDGDRTSDREPLEVAAELLTALEQNQFGSDPLSRLARAFRSDLLACGGKSALTDALSLIRVMQRDRQRVLARELLDAHALRAHHELTFRYSMDLMLVAAGSKLRASDVPELLDALGWCSTVRDLESDLAQGLVNIPREVVNAAQEAEGPRSLTDLVKTKAVHAWLRDELVRVLPLLERTDQRLHARKGEAGASVLALFARSIRRYAERRIPARFRELAALRS